MNSFANVFPKQHFLDSTSVSSSSFNSLKGKNGSNSVTVIMRPTSLQDSLLILKRTCLTIDHIPELKLAGVHQNDIKLSFKLYERQFSQYLSTLNHHLKISYLCILTKTYRQLIKEFGLFLLTQEHIKFNQEGQMALWINSDFLRNQPNWPLPSGLQQQAKAVKQLVGLMKDHFTQRFFKHITATTLKQLELFFQRANKRNEIHKKCQTIACQKVEMKRRCTQIQLGSYPYATSTYQHDRDASPTYFSSLLVPSHLNAYQQSYMGQPQTNMAHSRTSNFSKSFKTQDTNISTNIKNHNNTQLHEMPNQKSKSNAQHTVNSQRIFKVDESRSSISSMYRKSSGQNLHKTSTRTKQKRKQSISQDMLPNEVQYRRKGEGKKSLAVKSSLEMCLNNLFLSHISQDPQNEVYGSGVCGNDNLKDFLQDFSNVFY